MRQSRWASAMLASVAVLMFGCKTTTHVEPQHDAGVPQEDAAGQEDAEPQHDGRPPHLAAIGGDCYVAEDCPEGAICYTAADGLPGGYCVIEDCTSTSCPAGSMCYESFSDGVPRCVEACQDSSTCRQEEGYACNSKGFCWPVDNAVPPGGSCGYDTDCMDAANGYCYVDAAGGWVGGYCVTLYCTAGSCPAGSKCIEPFFSGGESACIATCAADWDCREGYVCYQQAGDPLDQTCLPGCATDDDCPSGFACRDDGSGALICKFAPPWCDSAHPNGDCNSGELCQAGACVAYTCSADAKETNNTLATATAMPASDTPGLSICTGDQDWFALTPAQADTYYYVGKDAPYTTGDLELTLTDASGAVVDETTFIRENEFNAENPVGPANLEATGIIGAAGSAAYYAHVFPAGLGQQAPYTLLYHTTTWKDGPDCVAAGFTRGECRAQNAAGQNDSSLLLPFPVSNPADPFIGDGIEFKNALGAATPYIEVSSRRYARREVIMIIRNAVKAVRDRFPGTTPLSVGDIGIIDGTTPEGHPNGTHYYGANLDLAYYIQADKQHGWNNPAYRSICCDKASLSWNACASTTTTGDCQSGSETTHIVDLPRTAHFLAKVAGSTRIRAIGCDVKIRPLLITELDTQRTAGWITQAERDGAANRLMSSAQDGSWVWHFNHMHLSFCTANCGSALTYGGDDALGPNPGASVPDLACLWAARAAARR
ncbi:MAG: hypothetical protein HY906_25995 [Deltaproteobacteria bacterium]|nr:hypothetical protein [Deltaproteobacteria bacterium]